MKKIAIYTVLLIIISIGCKKYDEGPLISLRSKEARLCREWKLEKEFRNGEEHTAAYEQYYEFKKDGTAAASFVLGDSDSIIFDMEWKWSDNKEFLELKIIDDKAFQIKQEYLSLLFKNESDSEWIELQIKRLKSNELIIEEQSENEIIRMEFKEK